MNGLQTKNIRRRVQCGCSGGGGRQAGQEGAGKVKEIVDRDCVESQLRARTCDLSTASYQQGIIVFYLGSVGLAGAAQMA